LKKRNPFLKPLVASLLQQGYSASETAKLANCSAGYVYALRKKLLNAGAVFPAAPLTAHQVEEALADAAQEERAATLPTWAVALIGFTALTAIVSLVYLIVLFKE
jgi:hypothetical protein